MATEPKKRSITGKLVENKLTERSDDYTFNTTYVQSRSVSLFSTSFPVILLFLGSVAMVISF